LSNAGFSEQTKQSPKCGQSPAPGSAGLRFDSSFNGHSAEQAIPEQAGLYSLVATCEANGVNPVAYLADVLMRLSIHPMSQLDELLPPNWQPSA